MGLFTSSFFLISHLKKKTANRFEIKLIHKQTRAHAHKYLIMGPNETNLDELFLDAIRRSFVFDYFKDFIVLILSRSVYQCVNE